MHSVRKTHASKLNNKKAKKPQNKQKTPQLYCWTHFPNKPYLYHLILHIPTCLTGMAKVSQVVIQYILVIQKSGKGETSLFILGILVKCQTLTSPGDPREVLSSAAIPDLLLPPLSLGTVWEADLSVVIVAILS